MKLKVEFSKLVRRKMKALKKDLTDRFGKERHLERSWILYVNHNYLFYYFEDKKVIIAEMFDEREDFMYKLFGISSESEESADYWGE